MISNFEKQIADLCLDKALFVLAIKNRVDFFELMRCDNEQDYNRENPLYPLSKEIFIIFKNRAKELENG